MRLILSEALQGLRRNASMVISVVLVTLVSLTFVGAAAVIQLQIGTMRSFWVDRAQVAVYMCSSVSTGASCVDGKADEDQLDAVREKLESPSFAPLVKDVRFESGQQAYDNVVTQFGEEYAALLSPDTMNETFWVNLNDQTQSEVIVEAFTSQKGVEQVKNQMDYLEPLFQSLTVATYVAVGVAALMLIAAVLLIATTIRLSAYARRREISIMRLVGASNRYIQTPFVLEGVFAALIGALLAGGAVLAGVHFGVGGYLKDRVTFITTWVTLSDIWWVPLALVVVGIVLAAFSAGFAIRRWLRA